MNNRVKNIVKMMAVLMGLFVCGSMLAQNGNVREETARQVGLNFLRLKDENPRSDLQLTRVDAVQYPNLYVYNTSENGFIVVASDNRMEPILAYSDEGTFDKDNVAPGADFWFEMYEYAIDSIVRNNVRDVDEKITRKWEDLRNGILPEQEKSGNYPDSWGPLIMTKWGQGSVKYWDSDYNEFCPYYESGGKTYKAVTGCVATALAQMLYYFNVNIPRRNIRYAFTHNLAGNDYPGYESLKLNGIDGVYSSKLVNGCDLPPRKYYSIGGWNDYSGMDRIAKMMLDCGLAVDMTYGHGSGAWTLQRDANEVCPNLSSAEKALKQYFGFPQAVGHTPDDDYDYHYHWTDTLKKYICHNIPIMYKGHKAGGASHSFICDGYDTDGKFHFNFGEGVCGNYFINDVYGYNVSQGALFVIPVSDEDYNTIVVYDTLQFGESKNYEWCNGIIKVMPGTSMYVSKDSIIYNHPAWYRLINRCDADTITLSLNVLITAMGDTISDGVSIECKGEPYDYHGSYNGEPFIIHLSRAETFFSGESHFVYKYAYSSRTGEFLCVCQLLLIGWGDSITENYLPPVTVSRCDLPQHGDYYYWDTGDEIIRCRYSGIYEKVCKRQDDCDSIVYLDLTIEEPENRVFTDTLLCYNSCPFNFHGIEIDLQSDTIGRITTYNVCENDVLYTLELHLVDTVPEVLAHTICTDEAPFTWRGHTLPWTTPGNYDTVFRVTTAECMCDTIFYVSLSIFDCCEPPLDCIEENLEEGNKSTPSNTEAIYYGLKHYFDYRGAMNGFLVNVLKGITWHNIEERNSFWNLFQSLLDTNSGMMSEEAKQQLITANPYTYVSENYITDLVERYNRSVLYWNEGQYSVWYLPQGYNPDNFIEYDTTSMNKAYEAYDYAITHGFSDVKAMYDNAYELLAAEVDNIQSAVCAHVTVKFTQKMTMTREAFNGTLQIFNGHESIPMQDIMVDFRVTDPQGNDCTNLFQIDTLSLDQITGISGNGSLAAQTNGTALVQFIPTKNAAPTQPVVYSFGGSFSFIDPFTGEGLTYPLYPVDITVNPSPDLYVDYFMQRDILGDDALTLDVVEPSVPAELGVIIHNQGAGMAKNVLLETAEPQIIDNEKGLAIDFAMYGASFNGSPRQLGLMEIPFGNIESGQTAVGEWLFTSSLLGHFVSYEAHVIHNNSYGNPDLSLVSHLDIHELIHPIYAYGNLDDGINDFLVNDNPDAYDMPDSIYFSHGGRTAVGIVDSISFDHYVEPQDTIVILTINPSRIGWNYGATEDPGRDNYDLVSCTRDFDGQVIPLNNVWQTFVTIPDGGDPVYENKLHIVDTIPVLQTTTYTLVYSQKANQDNCDMQTTWLSQGWNWWSTYIEQNGLDGLSMLENSLGENGVFIHSQADGFANYYDDYGWYGSLTSINNESSYMINASAPCEVSMVGMCAQPAQHPITLNADGWTWIGYPVNVSLTLDEAFANHASIVGDMVKAQEGYAEYYEDYGWYGTLETLLPGMGLMFKSTSLQPSTFTYPDGMRGNAANANLTSKNNHWVPEISAYSSNMTVTAVVDLDEEEIRSGHYELAAFANGECRGSVALKYVDPIDRYVAFLTISGDDPVMLYFNLFDSDSWEEYSAEETAVYEENAIVGRLKEPMTLHFNSAMGVDEFNSRVELYPNPVNRGERIGIVMNADVKAPVHVEIIDALGVEVLRASSVQTPVMLTAPTTAGVYMLRVTVEGEGTCYKKLIVR